MIFLKVVFSSSSPCFLKVFKFSVGHWQLFHWFSKYKELRLWLFCFLCLTRTFFSSAFPSCLLRHLKMSVIRWVVAILWKGGCTMSSYYGFTNEVLTVSVLSYQYHDIYLYCACAAKQAQAAVDQDLTINSKEKCNNMSQRILSWWKVETATTN